MSSMEDKLKQLEEENRMFRMILEALPINLFVKDTNCKYQITSKICDILNGVERGGLKGKSILPLNSSEEKLHSIALYDDDQRIILPKTKAAARTYVVRGRIIKRTKIPRKKETADLKRRRQLEGIAGGMFCKPAEMSTDEKLKKLKNRWINNSSNALSLIMIMKTEMLLY
jgi:hypothetical protein